MTSETEAPSAGEAPSSLPSLSLSAAALGDHPLPRLEEEHHAQVRLAEALRAIVVMTAEARFTGSEAEAAARILR